MATVLDTFLIEIGLDPTKLTTHQKIVVASAKQAAGEIKKTGDDIEKSSRRSADFLGMVNSKLQAFGGLLVSGAAAYGLQQFVSNITRSDAATGRLAYTLGTNVKALDVWRNAAYLAGGSADAITNDIQGLTNQFQDFSITGQSSVIPWFKALNVEIADGENRMRPFQDIMRDLANSFQKMDPVKAAAFGRNMGLSPDTVNLLIKGGDALDKILATSTKLSTLDPQSAENARQLAVAYNTWEIAITGVGRALLNYFTPNLLSIMGEHVKTFKELSEGKFISPGSLLDSMINGTKFRGFGPRPAGDNTGAGGAFKDNNEKEAFIRAEAAKRGISPDVAMAVAKSEGFYNYESTVIRKDGTREPSFGAFQLYMGGGLGNKFQKQTGLDPRNKETEREQIKFALDEASKGGWKPWHGWKGAPFAGISAGAGTAAVASANDNSSTTSNDIKIGQVNVQTQATDAEGIANSIGPAIKRSSQSFQSQRGPE